MNNKNQKVVKIEPLGAIEHKRKDGEVEKFLVALRWEELLNVMSDLDAPTFVLWQYILKWRGKKEGYSFAPADLEIKFGWSENSSRKYFKTLVQKHYLTQINNTHYSFTPYPEEVTYRAAKIREDNRIEREKRLNKNKT